jgi:short subunit fatty acids transporter
LDSLPWIGRVAGAIGLAALSASWLQAGVELTHNTVNFLLLSIGLLIHGSPLSYAKAISGSVRGTSGVILQFPFYGGILEVMKSEDATRLAAMPPPIEEQSGAQREAYDVF